jgi:hypothetical protein
VRRREEDGRGGSLCQAHLSAPNKWGGGIAGGVGVVLQAEHAESRTTKCGGVALMVFLEVEKSPSAGPACCVLTLARARLWTAQVPNGP